ncbi:SnoaL-like domain-containing protein [Cladophialophora immunda]|nr:SnoaL-like domain-containing protein [Cladophialophora immunda]
MKDDGVLDARGYLEEDDLSSQQSTHAFSQDGFFFILTAPFQLHKPELYQEEQEILNHICGWSHVMNKLFHQSIEPGRRFYDFDDAMTYDIYGFTPRGGMLEHYNQTFHYFSNSRFEMKDLEPVATSKASGYITMMQRLVGGTSDDGNKFEMTYRITYILAKIDGAWKFIHEHVSFPTDMSTMKADPTCTIDPLKAFRGIAT